MCHIVDKSTLIHVHVHEYMYMYIIYNYYDCYCVVFHLLIHALSLLEMNRNFVNLIYLSPPLSFHLSLSLSVPLFLSPLSLSVSLSVSLSLCLSLSLSLCLSLTLTRLMARTEFSMREVINKGSASPTLTLKGKKGDVLKVVHALYTTCMYIIRNNYILKFRRN